jgi:hypothetical protein
VSSTNFVEEMNDLFEGFRPSFSGYQDERGCANCTRYAQCWDNQSDIFQRWIFPTNFQLRPHWDTERYNRHIRTIIGQHCNNFDPRDERARARLEQAQRNREVQAKIAEQKEKGWDW